MWRGAEIIAERGGKNGRYPGGSGVRVAKILFLGGQELNLYLIRR